MSESIDPVSLEMGGKRTCSVIHFQKVQGGKVEGYGKLPVQLFYRAIKTHVYSIFNLCSILLSIQGFS